ncbi:alpha/beta fold hydrolase [Sphingosinicella sp. BN140058]|uniref:alpha/beta fold hydrolase n=1 Tax=Sphingosinicella sp. BN140058 TaxID=1892855 RepID=UPI001010A01C|nr:alpha/beta hydrolase [Sphingosinicella sp. BN140058]QAY76741.1 alpha/beta hydrolase [Sphingosinicella sp. BN140058]
MSTPTRTSRPDRLRALRLALALWVAGALGAPAQAQAPGTSEAHYSAVRPMIADMQKVVTPNGIEVNEAVTLNGLPQWISIRGADRRNPILIYVHGGPGATEMGRSWPYQRGWEDYFTVVQWDQPGSGKTLRSGGEAANRAHLSRARMAEDLVALIERVSARLGARKVVLLGHSWGNLIGLDAAMRRPDLISAYVGVGPLFSLRPNEAAQYRALLTIATERKDDAALAELRAIAPYPGEGDIPFDKINVVRKWVMAYGGLAAYRDNADFYFRAARLSPYYDLADRQAIDQGGQLSVPALLPDMIATDHRSIAASKFPMFMFLGRHDITTPASVIEPWFAKLRAPHKEIVWFENSAHLAPHEEPGKFLIGLVETVRPWAVKGNAAVPAR